MFKAHTDCCKNFRTKECKNLSYLSYTYVPFRILFQKLEIFEKNLDALPNTELQL